MSRGLCEPGQARWVPRLPRRAPRSNDSSLSLGVGSTEKPRARTGSSGLTVAHSSACVDPADALDPVDAELLGELRGEVELAAGDDRAPVDHLGQDVGAVLVRDVDQDAARQD